MKISDIQQMVAAHYGITQQAMVGVGRMRVITRPRQVAMWISRRALNRSLPEIGRQFRRDQSTVGHAIELIDILMARDPAFAHEVNIMLDAARPALVAEA